MSKRELYEFITLVIGYKEFKIRRFPKTKSAIRFFKNSSRLNAPFNGCNFKKLKYLKRATRRLSSCSWIFVSGPINSKYAKTRLKNSAVF
jgi:hypothetical protein